MAALNRNLTLWQWNCRGFGQKRHVVHQLLSCAAGPDILALQEPSNPLTLPGYTSITPTSPTPSRVAFLINRSITTISHCLAVQDIDHLLIELVPQHARAKSLFILNVYSSPKCLQGNFQRLFTLAKRIANKCPLLVVGDFNAPHTAWGYPRDTPKGRRVWLAAQQAGLSLLTDSAFPTRIGNSVCKDTTPDLSFAHRLPHATWCNTQENLGSDHYIIEILLNMQLPRRVLRGSTFTNWDFFRTYRATRTHASITDITEWSEQLRSDVRSATRLVREDCPSDTVDSRLLHLWDAKTSLERRWQSQRWNRTLRRRLARLSKEIETHAATLSRQNWESLCNKLDGNMSMPQTWNLFRHLIDPTQSKTTQRHNLTKLLHTCDKPPPELLQELRNQYFPTYPAVLYPDYTGPPNELLDQPITVAEVQAELQKLNTSSAPGPDNIHNKALRNLDDQSIAELTEYFNECWLRGILPPQWKEAKVVFIPKPGKPLLTSNLRPISLTSCVGKLMEHVLQTRLCQYLEGKNLLPACMFGFRPGLSTQDVFLQLKHHILDSQTCDTRAILGVDLTKAFDNVAHSAILENLITLGVGVKMYNYVRDFLSHRTATLTFGDHSLPGITLGARGTPQGAVLSPILFNIALLHLPQKLGQIPDIHFSFYADDITVWANRGSDAEIEEHLQLALTTIDTYVRERGLTCSPSKSELFLYRPKQHASAIPPISLTLGAHPIPLVSKIRVLGLVLYSHGAHGEVIRTLQTHAQQTIRLIRRIANRRAGLRERNTLRLTQAYIVSRTTYALPYLPLRQKERDRINALLRSCTKTALRLPPSTSNDRLFKLGVHNTFEELAEATFTAQICRLSNSVSGRALLTQLNLSPITESPGRVPLSSNLRSHLNVPPIPKNMHPVRDEKRRKARARALQRQYGEDQNVVYVDAAEYASRSRMALAVADNQTNLLTSCSIVTNSSTEAEEAAIALALISTPATTIISDSKSAILNYANGLISCSAARLLRFWQPQCSTTLIWTPAHAGLLGNEEAHSLARGLTFRAGEMEPPPQVEERLLSFRDILSYYREQRRIYAPPAPSLNIAQATHWRRLQTRTAPYPVLLNARYPDHFPSSCKLCDKPGDFLHILLTCPTFPHPPPPAVAVSYWETIMTSTSAFDQRRIISCAMKRIALQGLSFAL